MKHFVILAKSVAGTVILLFITRFPSVEEAEALQKTLCAGVHGVIGHTTISGA